MESRGTLYSEKDKLQTILEKNIFHKRLRFICLLKKYQQSSGDLRLFSTVRDMK